MMTSDLTGWEERWRALTSDERWLLEHLGGLDGDGNMRTDVVQVRYALDGMSERLKAACASLLLQKFIDAEHVPGGPLTYGITPEGEAILILGRPETPEDAKETARVAKAFNSRIGRRRR